MSLPVSDPRHYAPVTRPYRRWLAVSMALLLHLAVIGGVANWRLAPAPAERTSLDVVLVTRPAESPEQAEAIAERSQRARGEGEREALAEARAAASREATPAPPTPPVSRAEAAAPATPPSGVQATETEEGSDEAAPREPSPAAAPGESAPPAPAATPSRSGRDLLARATERIREQGLSAEPSGTPSDARQRAARQAAEARYIDDWTRRVEDYGNRVHPAPRDLEGQLRIRVVIGRDGELRQAEVIQSSGHAELDQAALATVRGAAPYRPFDRGMGNLDSLSITRVWRFGQGNHYGVQ